MSSAAYRLKEGESCRAGVRRAARGRAARAAEQLREASDSDLAVAVHGARKNLKKLRSLLRLCRGSIGQVVYRRENERFRAAARMLGDARDAEAKLESLEELQERFGGRFPTRWSGDFVTELERRRDDVGDGSAPEAVSEAIDSIEVGERAIERWRFEADGFELFREGLERAYRRGRNRLGEVIEDPSDEAVHEWRKRVKDMWYQLRFLQRIWPPVMKGVFEQAHELSSVLGDHHDLAVLREDVLGAPELFGGSAQLRLLELIGLRQQELIETALPAGRRLYAEKPRRFVDRMAAYWSEG